MRKAGNSFYDNLADLFEAKSKRFGQQHVDMKDVWIDDDWLGSATKNYSLGKVVILCNICQWWFL